MRRHPSSFLASAYNFLTSQVPDRPAQNIIMSASRQFLIAGVTMKMMSLRPMYAWLSAATLDNPFRIFTHLQNRESSLSDIIAHSFLSFVMAVLLSNAQDVAQEGKNAEGFGVFIFLGVGLPLYMLSFSDKFAPNNRVNAAVNAATGAVANVIDVLTAS